jgi:hypothetical protein
MYLASFSNHVIVYRSVPLLTSFFFYTKIAKSEVEELFVGYSSRWGCECGGVRGYRMAWNNCYLLLGCERIRTDK